MFEMSLNKQQDCSPPLSLIQTFVRFVQQIFPIRVMLRYGISAEHVMEPKFPKTQFPPGWPIRVANANELNPWTVIVRKAFCVWMDTVFSRVDINAFKTGFLAHSKPEIIVHRKIEILS